MSSAPTQRAKYGVGQFRDVVQYRFGVPMKKMILLPFVTQATEPAPGASIEEPRVRNTNLAA